MRRNIKRKTHLKLHENRMKWNEWTNGSRSRKILLVLRWYAICFVFCTSLAWLFSLCLRNAKSKKRPAALLSLVSFGLWLEKQISGEYVLHSTFTHTGCYALLCGVCMHASGKKGKRKKDRFCEESWNDAAKQCFFFLFFCWYQKTLTKTCFTF